MKFRIFLKSFENELIDFASQQLYRTLVQNEAKVKGIVSLPIRIKRFCVLRSPHIDKDSREHFEVRIHKRIIDVYDPTSKTIDSLMKLDLPSGIDIDVRL